MNVEIGTEAPYFPFWEYFSQFSVRYLSHLEWPRVVRMDIGLGNVMLFTAKSKKISFFKRQTKVQSYNLINTNLQLLYVSNFFGKQLTLKLTKTRQ
jgi:hypothetical protein